VTHVVTRRSDGVAELSRLTPTPTHMRILDCPHCLKAFSLETYVDGTLILRAFAAPSEPSEEPIEQVMEDIMDDTVEEPADTPENDDGPKDGQPF
jgi:hypothetical protein